MNFFDAPVATAAPAPQATEGQETPTPMGQQMLTGAPQSEQPSVNFFDVPEPPKSSLPAAPDALTAKNLPDDKILADKIGSWKGLGPELSDSDKAVHASIAQAFVMAAQDMSILARNLGGMLGLADEKKTAQMQADFNSERQQFANLPYIKANPIKSSLISQGGEFALNMAGPAKLVKGAGLAGGVIKGALGDAISAGAAGAMAIPEEGSSRLSNGLISGALGGAIGLAGRAVGSVANKFLGADPAKVAENSALFEKSGVTPTVGQLSGNTALQETEASLTKWPLVGGKQGLLNQQTQIEQAQRAFAQSVKPAEGVANQLYDDVLTTMKGKPVTVNQQELMALQNSLEKSVDLNPMQKKVLDKIYTLNQQTDMDFQKLWDFRKNVDTILYGESGIKAPAAADPSGSVGKLRDILQKSLQDNADAGGAGAKFSMANSLFRQNLASQKIQQFLGEAYDGIITGSTGRSITKFGQLLEKNASNLTSKLDDPELKAAYNGMIKLVKATAPAVQGVKGTVDRLGLTLEVAGGLGAHSLVGITNPMVVAVPLLIKGYSSLLNSGAGRALLKHAASLKTGSTTLKSIANQVIKGAAQVATTGQQLK